MFGVCYNSTPVFYNSILQTLVYDILGGGCRKAMLGVCYNIKLQALVYDILGEVAGKRCSEGATTANSEH